MFPTDNRAMTPYDLMPHGPAPRPRARSLPVLLVLFVGSGCAALIYEVVWLQLLQLVIGSTAVSLGVLLGTFMGGMCAGSLLLPRTRLRPPAPPAGLRTARAGHRRHRARGTVRHAVCRAHVYTLCRPRPGGHLIARGCGRRVLVATHAADGRHAAGDRAWVETGPEGVSWLGFFYGGNIAGAVFGCLLAGFYLLRVYDMATATYVAVALNVTVAAIALALAAATARYEVAAKPATKAAQGAPSGAWAVYVAIALSGCRRWAAEVIWTRLLSSAAWRHRVHLLADLGRVSDRPGDWQQLSGRSSRGGPRRCGWRWASASGCLPWRSPGPP